MATIPERIHDVVVRHRIGLNRYSTTLVRRMLALLNRTEASVVERLSEETGETPTGRRLDQLLTAVREIQAEGWAQVRPALEGRLEQLVGVETDFAHGVAQLAAKGVGVELASGAPALDQVMGAVRARPFQGRLLKEWLSQAEAGAAARVRETIRQGFVEGETTDQIVRKLRGTRAAQYRDGVMEVSRRGAEAMVRTAITHTSTVAHQKTWEAHSDVIVGLIWTSTLDNRTSHVCIARSEQVFPIDKGPRPPAHISCRSTMRPKVRDIEGVAPMKAMSYAEWLKRQPVAVQDDILGPARGALFRTGGFTVDRFVDDAGKTLTLAQLRQRDADGFRESGLDLPIKPPPGVPKDEIAKFLADPAAQKALMVKFWGSQESADRALRRVREVADNEGWKAKDTDMSAIRWYTGDGYKGVNQRMRDGGFTLEDRQFTMLASRGLDDLPQETGPVWRAPSKHHAIADRFWERAVPGENLDLGNQLQSFSRDLEVVRTWSAETRLLLEIKNPGRGAYISPISQIPEEEEVLFPVGLTYRVVEKRAEVREGRIYRTIVLEVVT